MLSAVLFVLGCVGAVLSSNPPYASSSSGYPPSPSGYGPGPSGYGPGPSGYGGYGPNFGYGHSLNYAVPSHYEFVNIINNITYLTNNDIAITERLQALKLEDDENSEFADRFLQELFLKNRKEEAAQNREIAALERKAQTLLNTVTDIFVLNNTLAEIETEIVYLLGPAAEYRENLFNRVNEADQANDAALEAAIAQLEANDARLTELEGRSHAVKDLIEKITDTLHQVFNAINAENAETVQVTLTPEEPKVMKYLSVDFQGRRPEVVHGITLVHVSNHEQSYVYQHYSPGYGRSNRQGYGHGYVYGIDNNPSIYFNTDVSYDQDLNKLTATYYDLSTGGWTVEKITLNIVVFYVDNREIKTYQ